MKRKKRKIFQTREERDAWFAAAEARQRDLEALRDRLEAELAAKRKTA